MRSGDSSDLIQDPNFLYDQYATGVQPETFGPAPLPGSTAITTLEGLTGPTLSLSGGVTGYSFVPAGTTITLTVSNAATIRSAIGLGSIATQNSNNVNVSGGTITGITDLAVADGGTGSGTAAGARTNLGINAMAAQLSNMAAAVAPTVNEDSGDGYSPGSIWLDLTADQAYICLDSTLGAAVWKQMT